MPSGYVHVWMITSDNGPDQAAFRSQLKTLLASKEEFGRQLVFDTPCLKHQLHLLTHDMLRLASSLMAKSGYSGGYFASLAKVCHSWRAHGSKIAKVWATLVPNAFAFKASCNVPPLAIAGRWGSIDSHLSNVEFA